MKLVDDKLVTPMGYVIAEKIRGEWHTKEPELLQSFLDKEKSDFEKKIKESSTEKRKTKK